MGSRKARQTRSRPQSGNLKLSQVQALAFIHDAIAHTVGPISTLPRALPILERIARALEDRRDASELILDLNRRGRLLRGRGPRLASASGPARIRPGGGAGPNGKNR